MTTTTDRIVNAERLLNELLEQAEELQKIDTLIEIVNSYEADIETLRQSIRGLELRAKALQEILKRVSAQRARPGA